MPTIEDPRPQEPERTPSPSHPYFSLFLEADKDLVNIRPNLSSAERVSLNSWQERFLEETEIMQKKITKDYQDFTGQRFEYIVRAQVSTFSLQFSTKGFLEGYHDYESGTILGIVFMLGYELYDVIDGLEQDAAAIAEVLQNVSGLSEDEEVVPSILQVIYAGRKQWQAFHPIPQLFSTAAYNFTANLETLPTEIPDVFLQFNGILDPDDMQATETIDEFLRRNNWI